MVLENGNVLLSVKNEALEYEKGGHKIVWSYKLDSRNKELGTVNRLPNGNTLVNLRHGNKTVEFAPDRSVAWVCDNEDVGGRFADPCAGQRLPNGNTVIGSYGQKAPAKVKIFEVNREKEVVWEFFHPDAKAHEVHILTTNGIPVSPIYR